MLIWTKQELIKKQTEHLYHPLVVSCSIGQVYPVYQVETGNEWLLVVQNHYSLLKRHLFMFIS